GLELNQIADALDPLDPAYGTLRRLPLVLPLDLAFERHPATLDHDLDPFRGDRQLTLDRRHGIARDVGIRPLVDARHTHFEIIRHCADARYAFRCGLGFVLVGVAFDVARQGDD